ncbi:MAG: histidine kinase dimerization/phosphoacceptor domain -containing protein, partial [Spirochaetota bacterium]
QYNRSQIFRLKAEGRNRFTRRYKRKDGSILYAEVSSTFLTGVQKGYVSLVRDVSETFIQYDRFKIILNSINSIIYIADMETYEILFINEYARQVIGGVEGKTCWKVLQKDMSGPCPFCTNKYLVDSDGNATDGYSYIHRNTRNNRWYSLFSMAIPWHGKRLVRLEIANDITDIKMSEEHLRASNLEKDYLLKELNHRIKNNLLMISSLIQLKDGGKNTTADLTDIRNQIDAIRIIHQKLYSVNDTLMVDIKEYVSELLDTLFDAFMEKPVSTVVESDISTMNTHDAISIGLIINEMATNSIKHAFPEVSAPEFLARFRLEHPDTVILTISNNGPPLPADISMENPETLGLRLITGLVQQLNGTITIQNDDRLRFIITFPL